MEANLRCSEVQEIAFEAGVNSIYRSGSQRPVVTEQVDREAASGNGLLL
jgi:hypothetical protein